MRRQHAKGAIDVVAEARIHWRLNSHLINGKASGGPYGVRKLSLRLLKRTPGRIEVVLTRNQRREHFEAQPIRRFKFRMNKRARAPVLSARLVVSRGARAMADDIAGRNALVVCAR